MFEFINMMIAIIGSLAVGIWDLKTSDIPERIVMAMGCLGLLIAIGDTVVTGNVSYITSSVLTAVIFGIIGGILYVGKAWGDGDWALLVAVGINLTTFSIGSATILPVAASYIVNLFFVGMFYSALYMSVFISRNERAIREFYGKMKENSKYALLAFLLSAALYFSLPTIFTLAASVLFFVSVPFYILSLVGEKYMSRNISVKQLREGDVIAGGRIRGLTRSEVSRLRKAKKSITVKDGVRYGLVFFLALVATLAGDVTGLLLA